MFDLDGTLILSNRKLGSYQVIPGAVEVLTELERRGMPYLALTNGSAYPAAKQGPRLREVGLPIVDGHLFTPNSVAGKVFKERGYQNVLVLGTPGVVEALNGHGIRCSLPGDEDAKTADAVYTAWHPECSMADIHAAAGRVLDGAPFYTASDVPFFATSEGPAFGYSCAINGAIHRVTGRRAASDRQAEPAGDGLRRRQARPAAERDRGDRRRSQGRDGNGRRRRRDRRRRHQRHHQRASNGPRSPPSDGRTW